MACLALTEKRRIPCDGYIFPSEYYEIPGILHFQDLEAVRNYAFEKLKKYQGEPIDIYLNGGMSIEVLTVIQAAVKLDIKISLYHYNREKEKYICQEVLWRPVNDDRGNTIKEADQEAVSLCQGRHWGTERKSIFSIISDEQLFDFQWQELQAEKFLQNYEGKTAVIYLSGLTAAFVSVLNAAVKINVSIIWLHYDHDTEEYFAQNMDRF